MQDWFNIKKSINVSYHFNKLEKKYHIAILTDDEIAFDKI